LSGSSVRRVVVVQIGVDELKVILGYSSVKPMLARNKHASILIHPNLLTQPDVGSSSYRSSAKARSDVSDVLCQLRLCNCIHVITLDAEINASHRSCTIRYIPSFSVGPPCYCRMVAIVSFIQPWKPARTNTWRRERRSGKACIAVKNAGDGRFAASSPLPEILPASRALAVVPDV
jgi:hypothetical protein